MGSSSPLMPSQILHIATKLNKNTTWRRKHQPIKRVKSTSNAQGMSSYEWQDLKNRFSFLIFFPFIERNDRFLYPFTYLNRVKSLPFHIPEACKRYPLRAEPPRIGSTPWGLQKAYAAMGSQSPTPMLITLKATVKILSPHTHKS